MDRRFNPRYSTDLQVLLTHLDADYDSVGQFRGQLEDISDSGICSLFPHELAPGDIVKLEILGLVLYGHIVYSTPEDGAFRTGIFVEPALLDSSNITDLVKNYLIEPAARR